MGCVDELGQGAGRPLKFRNRQAALGAVPNAKFLAFMVNSMFPPRRGENLAAMSDHAFLCGWLALSRNENHPEDGRTKPSMDLGDARERQENESSGGRGEDLWEHPRRHLHHPPRTGGQRRPCPLRPSKMTNSTFLLILLSPPVSGCGFRKAPRLWMRTLSSCVALAQRHKNFNK